MEPEELKGKRIAVPGTLTTAYLAAKLFQPDFEAVVTPFDKITDAVQRTPVDAGLIIHEAQLTYDREGFHRVVDLGRWFKTTYGLPLPLGGTCCCGRSTGDQERMLPDDAGEHPIRAGQSRRSAEYALQFARDMEPRWPRNSWACTSTTTRWTPATWCRRRRRSCSIWATKPA